MTSLLDYVRGEFPDHELEVWGAPERGDRDLTDHTVVVRTVGIAPGTTLFRLLRSSTDKERTAAVVVRPGTDDRSSVDHEGTVDVDARRLVMLGLGGAIVAGGIVAVLAAIVSDTATAPLVMGVLGAVLGAIVAITLGGGARYGGARNGQPRSPHSPIVIVANMAPTADAEHEVVALLDAFGERDLRIVDRDGAWHLPGS